jgi:hypothetical protein
VQKDYKQRQLRRRMEVLRLPPTVLHRHGILVPSRDDPGWAREPEAVGVGPDGTALAVWASRHAPERRLITTHDGGNKPLSAVVLDGALAPTFVQPLPDGRILLASGRSRPRGGAQVWSADGRLLTEGHLGDAIEQLMTTPTGDIWVGYFDEAMSGTGPQTHGLARFSPDLAVDWLYPRTTLPDIFDCYTLNVAGETATVCPYTNFHIVSVTGNQGTDHGASPYRGAHNLVRAADRVTLIGGYGADYDLVTPLRLARGRVEPDGRQHRLVLPDGREIHNARSYCRGHDLHLFIRGTWYRTSIDDLRQAL